jgi:hypothetical protein
MWYVKLWFDESMMIRQWMECGLNEYWSVAGFFCQ